MRNFILTSETVTSGHPDKLCDRISDRVIDACLMQDPTSRAVAECAISSGVVFLSLRGVATPPCDLAALARKVLTDAGHGKPGEDGPTVMLDLDPAGLAVEGRPRNQMATVFGYACDHTPEGMPAAIWAAHRVGGAMEAARRGGRLPWLLSDARVQVAVRFRDRSPVAIAALAVDFAAATGTDSEGAAAEIGREVLGPAFTFAGVAPGPETRLLLHPVMGRSGPAAHAGLTGRKIADDTYGGHSRQSATALSGKSPDRIDRVGQYAARQAALCVVAAGLARECEVQLSYLLGEARPASVEVDTFDSGTIPDAQIERRLSEIFDFRADAIAERLGLGSLPAQRGGSFYGEIAVGGQMGRRDLDSPWEDTGDAARLA